MKTSILYLVMGLLVINSLSAQVKIGENPQNLDPSSILELQSTNRVLVITRVSDAQMNGINPLPGAVVYNTTHDCLHYYNGTEWINICEELDNSFTTSTRADYFSTINSAQSKDSTVVISQTENPDGSINYNYEVGLIRGANIVNTTINGDSKLQNGSVTRGKFQPGENQGDLMMWRGLEWALVNESELNVTEKDSIVGNEYNTESSIATGILTITDGGGDLQTNLISTETGNSIIPGTDGALYFNETLTTLVDNNDGTLTYTDEDGTPTNIDLTTAVAAVETLTTLVDNNDGTLTYTDEDGTPTNIDLTTAVAAVETLTTLVDNNDGTLTYTDEDGTPTTFNAKIATAVDNADGTFTITDDFGTQVDINTNETVTTLTDGGNGTFTYSSEDGTPTTFNAKIATAVDNADGTFTITDDFGTQVDINTNETVTTLTDGGNGTFTYSSEDGTPTTFNAKIATAVDNADGTFTITDDFGTQVDINTNETVTTLTDGGNGTFTYSSEDGTPTTFNAKIATAVDNADGTFTVTDDFGTQVDINTNENQTVSGGTGITITPTGLDFLVEVDNLAGDVTGPINATVIGPGVIDNANIAAGAAIAGSKIIPTFTNNVSTTGDFISNGVVLDVPDFVFQKYFNGYSSLNNDYKFRSLNEIESFIKENNHLPGIKSAYEVKADGKYYLTESSMAQLEKIEELFLHTIEQEKKIEALQSNNQKLAEELDSLKNEMKEIKAILLEKAQN